MNYTHDKLRGGTRNRIAKMRSYRDTWNAKIGTGDPRYRYRTPLETGMAGVLQARSHGAGEWDSSAHGIGDVLRDDAQERRGYVSAPVELVNGWRDVGHSDDIVSHIGHRGWYTDADCSETYRGHVWQIPARNGDPCYIAGYVESEDASGYVVLETNKRGGLELYDDKEDAARAGDRLAEHMAEDAKEYSERWHGASQASDERDEARTDSHAARMRFHALAVAYRIAMKTEAQTGADGLRPLLEREREAAREAVQTMIEKTERIRELNMTGEF